MLRRAWNGVCTTPNAAMVEIAFDGLPASWAVEASINRWVARLEDAHPILHCRVTIRREVGFLGTRTRLALAVETRRHHIAVNRETWIDDLGDLYLLVSNAFRDARQRLAPTPQLHVA
jgi:hypothetical protein